MLVEGDPGFDAAETKFSVEISPEARSRRMTLEKVIARIAVMESQRDADAAAWAARIAYLQDIKTKMENA
jgi:hypothetical protein